MTFDENRTDELAELLAHAADREILPRFRKLEEGGIRQKSSAADLVTDADEAAERFLTAELLDRFPGALVVGEEACESDASILPRLAGADLAFTIDPVDGTFNFAAGVPLFGVILSVVQGGETVAGIIYDPLTRSATVAVKGGGAWFRTPEGDRVACAVAPTRPLEMMIGSTAAQYFPAPERYTLARNGARCLSQIGYRCAAHEYRLLASGNLHFACHYKLMPWDHLAGALIHAEAGGFSARLDGSPYRPGDLAGGLMLAPDEATWKRLRTELWTE